MRNGISFKIDVDFVNLLKDVQAERLELRTDKNKKSLTKLSYLAFLILKEDANLEKLMTRRIYL